MEDIIVMPKPDWVSWEDIHQLLLNANKVNEKRGFSMYGLTLPPEKLEKQVADGGLCVVALHGNKLVGVSSCSFERTNKWYNKTGKVAKKFMTGILKSYQGCGILKRLDNELDKYIKQCRCDIIEASTAEQNLAIRKSIATEGFKELAYESFKSTGYYSVLFAKWLGECPYSDWYIRFRCWLSMIYIKTRYKVGRKERFRVLSSLWKSAKRLFKRLVWRT